jgi:hypothetical protein
MGSVLSRKSWALDSISSQCHTSYITLSELLTFKSLSFFILKMELILLTCKDDIKIRNMQFFLKTELIVNPGHRFDPGTDIILFPVVERTLQTLAPGRHVQNIFFHSVIQASTETFLLLQHLPLTLCSLFHL